MITIPEDVTPQFSYKNILENPLTEQVFTDLVSELKISDTVKKSLIQEFCATIHNFQDFSYTGDIDDFKVTLHTTLSDTPKNINLCDLLSTQEFVAKSTKAIENCISISLASSDRTVSLHEYIKITRKRKERTPNVLAVLRGLHSRNIDDSTWDRNTAEIIAALKKHLVLYNSNDSTLALASLVEKNKQNEIILKEDEVHHQKIKSYTDDLSKKTKPHTHNAYKKQYVDMLEDIHASIKYFSHSSDDRKARLHNVLIDFVTHSTKYGLYTYQRKYGLYVYHSKFGYISPDQFPIEDKPQLDIKDLMLFLDKYPQYKGVAKSSIDEEIAQLIKQIQYIENSINTFDRPTREKRVSQSPYRGAPIKLDQAYETELSDLKCRFDMYKKDLELAESYILAISKL